MTSAHPHDMDTLARRAAIELEIKINAVKNMPKGQYRDSMIKSVLRLSNTAARLAGRAHQLGEITDRHVQENELLQYSEKVLDTVKRTRTLIRKNHIKRTVKALDDTMREIDNSRNSDDLELAMGDYINLGTNIGHSSGLTADEETLWNELAGDQTVLELSRLEPVCDTTNRSNDTPILAPSIAD